MRAIKMLGLIAATMMAAIAVLGASSAMAEGITFLCKNDTGVCEEPETVHFEDKAITLSTTTPKLTIKCEALISATNLKVATPLVLDVAAAGFAYQNCTSGCSITVEVGGSINLLRLGAELADATGSGFKLRFKCGEVIDCKYTFAGLTGQASGSLITGEATHITYTEASLAREGGGLCPSTAKLSALFVSLEDLYIKDEPGKKENTFLCKNDTGVCEEPETVHFEDKAITLSTTTPKLTIKCEALISATNLKVATPLVLDVAAAGFAYQNCTSGCSITVEVGGSINLLRLGAELADATGSGFRLRFKCGEVVDCKYNWSGFTGHALGPLATESADTHLTYSEVSLAKESGGECPITAKLSALFISLEDLYIRE